jgi:hypothetical protein
MTTAPYPDKTQRAPERDHAMQCLHLSMELLHAGKQLRGGQRSGTAWSAAPRIVAAPTHVYGLAQSSEWVLDPMNLNKPIAHGDSLVKYMAAGSCGESNTCLQSPAS